MPTEHQRRIARAKKHSARWSAELDRAIGDALADGVAPAAVARVLGISRQSMHDRIRANPAIFSNAAEHSEGEVGRPSQSPSEESS